MTFLFELNFIKTTKNYKKMGNNIVINFGKINYSHLFILRKK